MNLHVISMPTFKECEGHVIKSKSYHILQFKSKKSFKKPKFIANRTIDFKILTNLFNLWLIISLYLNK